jgi:hypothetical protein
MTFISIHFVIIYVVFFGACMRCTRLCPLKPGVTPEEVICNFVSFELMIKGSKKINELDSPSTPKAQPDAFKATEEKKEESTSSRQPIDASKLNNEEMALIIKSFRQILKQRKGKDYKPRSKKVCYKCGKPGHFIAKCLLPSDSDTTTGILCTGGPVSLYTGGSRNRLWRTACDVKQHHRRSIKNRL